MVKNLERTKFQSLVGNILWIGTHTVPHLKYTASMLAQKNSNLMVKDLKPANSLLKFAKSLYAVLFYSKPEDKKYTLVMYTDASSNGPQEGSITFKMYGLRTGSVVHPLVWHSKKMSQLTISTLGLETLACVNGYSVAFYLRHFLKDCINSKL